MKFFNQKNLPLKTSDLELMVKKLKDFQVDSFEVKTSPNCLEFLFSKDGTIEESIAFISHFKNNKEKVFICYFGYPEKNEDFLIEERPLLNTLTEICFEITIDGCNDLNFCLPLKEAEVLLYIKEATDGLMKCCTHYELAHFFNSELYSNPASENNCLQITQGGKTLFSQGRNDACEIISTISNLFHEAVNEARIHSGNEVYNAEKLFLFQRLHDHGSGFEAFYTNDEIKINRYYPSEGRI